MQRYYRVIEECDLENNPWPYTFDVEHYYKIELLSHSPDAGDDVLVPVPPSLNLKVGGAYGTIGSDDINSVLETRQKGVPQVLLATVPYTAWNFEGTVRCTVAGPYSFAGVIGLAEDADNYLVGWIAPGRIGISMVRDGIETIVEDDYYEEIKEGRLYDVRFYHRDGFLGVDVKQAQDLWGSRGSTLGIGVWWEDSFGAIATNDLIFHCGIYAYINPPKFRTPGFLSTQAYIPVLPCDVNPDEGSSDFQDRFDSSGQVDIEGAIYNFLGKIDVLGPSDLIMGPFQLRNIGDWSSPFNSDREGYTYQGGRAIEITQFNWWSGTLHALDFQNSIVASSSGYNWLLDQTLWKVWITTGGAVVWLRNRARHYSDDLPDYYPDTNERVFITDGLSGVTSVTNDGTEYAHPYGAFVFAHHGDKVAIHGFSAFSGMHDQSIQVLLDKFCKIAGTQASFIGDTVLPTLLLENGVEYPL
jgi:hypothetical protein